MSRGGKISEELQLTHSGTWKYLLWLHFDVYFAVIILIIIKTDHNVHVAPVL